MDERLPTPHMLYYVGRAFFRAFFTLMCRWRVEGIENIPKTGGVIYAPNHTSHLDPPLVGSAGSRRTFFMAKWELFSVPILGWCIRRTHAFPVSRGSADRQAIRQAEGLLKRGEVVILFPEGTRSEDGRLQDAELGLAMIAARAGVPVVPVGIIGSNRALPRGSVFVRPAQITVRFGTPVFCDSVTSSRVSREVLQPFSDKIMNGIRELLPPDMGGTRTEASRC